MAAVTVQGDLAFVAFDRFGIEQYELFLRTKKLPESQITYDWQADRYTLTTPARFAPQLGAAVPEVSRNRPETAAHLYDYQRWALDLALEAKRFALWLDTGLGKTSVYLEYARQVLAMTGGRVLILAPLAVIPQVVDEARRWYGDSLPVTPLATRDALVAWCQAGSGLGICNYEKFIPGVIPELRLVAGLIADESSVLRTGGGTIKWNLIKSARGIEYKLSCTATPAPNEAMEYASQAAFLEKLRSEGDILWTYFQRDKRGEWTVKPHARQAFYRFMASWSLYLRDPAVFGFGNILATLPEPEIIEESLPVTDAQRALLAETLTTNQVGLWADDRVSVTVRSKLLQVARGFRYSGTGSERRVELVDSAKPVHVAEIVRREVAQGHQVLVWTTFDAEATLIQRALLRFDTPTYAIMDGSMPVEARVEILNAYRAGDIRVLISKPQLIGYGLNLQFVRAMVFSGFDDSFERLYQAVRRAYRLGQTETVRVYLPFVPELEGMVFDNLKRKEARFLEEVSAQEREYQAAMAATGALHD